MKKLCVLIPCLIILMTHYCSGSAEAGPASAYWLSSSCRNCHNGIYDQHSQSMHAKSFSNEVFQAQYYKEVLPRVDTDPTLWSDARDCLACHSPIPFLDNSRTLLADGKVDPEQSGITCDFCHTIRGYRGENPGNADYVTSPGEQKLGPLFYKSSLSWHHAYSDLHTKSEFCAICHHQVNRFGIEIKSTYTEWKNSLYQQQGIQCQDCHMNAQGFLTGGQPVFEDGAAARASLVEPRYRAKLHTHRFPGAHSKTQVTGALTLDIKVAEPTVSAGDEITIHVFIDNSRTGHKMPSGSADLRLLWLELKAYVTNDRTMNAIPVIIPLDAADSEGKDDRGLAEDDIPAGSRIYRAVFLDKAGKQIFASYNAAKIGSDNRLDAAEIRKESYRFKIPDSAVEKLYLYADLNYLPYPARFAEQLGLPKPDSVVIASDKQVIPLQ